MDSHSASSHRSEGWTRRKVGFLLLALSPFIALLIVLAWGQLRTGGNPGGLAEYANSGEVPVNVHPAPQFSGVDLVNGGQIDNASLKGKVAMIDFWSSWCTSCVSEASDLASVYKDYAGQPVQFVGLAIWDESGPVLNYLSRYGVTYPVMVDVKGETAVDYGVRGVPEKFFLDRNGNIVRKITGPLTPDKLHEIIDSLLAG